MKFLIALLMTVVVSNSWAAGCAKGYSSAGLAVSSLSFGFGAEDLSFCTDLKKRKSRYANDEVYKSCDIEGVVVAVSVFKIVGGVCFPSNKEPYYVATIDFSGFDEGADVDPNR